MYMHFKHFKAFLSHYARFKSKTGVLIFINIYGKGILYQFPQLFQILITIRKQLIANHLVCLIAVGRQTRIYVNNPSVLALWRTKSRI